MLNYFGINQNVKLGFMSIMECHRHKKYVLQKACASEHNFSSSLFAVLKPVQTSLATS
jgi:hypothetical protein